MPPPLDPDRAAAQIRRLLPGPSHLRTLTAYRGVGLIVSRLDTAYGSKAVEKLQRALIALGVKGMKFSMLHKCKRVAQQLDARTIRQMEQRGTAWRDLANVLSKSISDARRRELINQVIAGKLDPTKLGKRIDSAVGVRRFANPKSLVAAQNATEAVLRRLAGMLTNPASEEQYESTVKAGRQLQRNLAALLRGHVLRSDPPKPPRHR